MAMTTWKDDTQMSAIEIIAMFVTVMVIPCLCAWGAYKDEGTLEDQLDPDNLPVHPYTRSDHANQCGECGKPMFDPTHGPVPPSNTVNRGAW